MKNLSNAEDVRHLKINNAQIVKASIKRLDIFLKK